MTPRPRFHPLPPPTDPTRWATPPEPPPRWTWQSVPMIKPTSYPDGSPYGGCLHEKYTGLAVYSVGWLGDRLPEDDLARAPLPPHLLDALGYAALHHGVYDGWMGLHTCRLCGVYADHCELHMQAGAWRYVLPMMIFHYIQVHGYQPPVAFIDDIQDAPRDIPEALQGWIRAGCSPMTGCYDDNPRIRLRALVAMAGEALGLRRR